MKAPNIEVYRDRKRQWRWRLRASNGKIVCDGAEAYARKPTRLQLARVADGMHIAVIGNAIMVSP